MDEPGHGKQGIAGSEKLRDQALAKAMAVRVGPVDTGTGKHLLDHDTEGVHGQRALCMPGDILRWKEKPIHEAHTVVAGHPVGVPWPPHLVDVALHFCVYHRVETQIPFVDAITLVTAGHEPLNPLGGVRWGRLKGVEPNQHSGQSQPTNGPNAHPHATEEEYQDAFTGCHTHLTPRVV